MRIFSTTTLLTAMAATLAASAPAAAHFRGSGERGFDPREQRIYDNDYDQRGYGEREAIGQCIRAAQHEARRFGNARVTEVSDIDDIGRGFEIRGKVVADSRDYNRRGYGGYGRYGYGNDRYRGDYNRGRFTCTVRYGRVEDIRISGLNRGW
jgi:hypothetical protein